MYDKLFSPIKIRGLELKNRIVLPAMMTKMTTDDYQGIVGDNLVQYHAAIAKGGCGLNITEVMAVHPSTHGYAYCALYEDKHEAPVKKLIDAVHANGGKICIQLWHGGKTVNSMIDLLSEEQKKGRIPVMKENNINDVPVSLIDEIVECFGKSAARAVKLGVDALEYHTAHMYLGHSFLSSEWNQRTDEYGGSLENRSRFIRRVITEIRKNMPEDMPLLMRIDVQDDFVANGLSIEDIAQVLKWVHELGVDVADVSRGNAVTPALRYEVPTMDTPNGFNMENVKKLKSLLPSTMKVIGVGRVNTGAFAEKFLEEGCADLIAMGRAQICDHDFANKTKNGQEDQIRRCLACNKGCFDAVMDKRMPHMMCARNVFVGNLNRKFEKVNPQNAKKVLIAGGGIAGITAARFLKQRGHNPIICEKSSQLGGQMKLASALPYKYEWINVLNWEIENAKKENIDIRLNTTVTPELIEQIKPDAVIIATGAHAEREKFENVDSSKVVSFEDVLNGSKTVKGNVVIVGGGMYGCETAQALVEKGIRPLVLEKGPMLAMDAGWIRAFNLMINVPSAGVRCLTNAKDLKFANNKLTFTGTNHEKKEVTETIDFDYIISANKPVTTSYEAIESKCKSLNLPTYIIGDSKQVESVMWAVNQAADVALDEIK